MEKDNSRKGKIVEYSPKIDQEPKIKIIKRRVVEKTIDYETSKIIVSMGRGIKDNPEQNIKLD